MSTGSNSQSPAELLRTPGMQSLLPLHQHTDSDKVQTRVDPTYWQRQIQGATLRNPHRYPSPRDELNHGTT